MLLSYGKLNFKKGEGVGVGEDIIFMLHLHTHTHPLWNPVQE